MGISLQREKQWIYTGILVGKPCKYSNREGDGWGLRVSGRLVLSLINNVQPSEAVPHKFYRSEWKYSSTLTLTNNLIVEKLS